MTIFLKGIGKTSEIIEAGLKDINTGELTKYQDEAATLISKDDHKNGTKDNLDTQKEDIHNFMVEQEKGYR